MSLIRVDELVEALKTLTYEHGIFFKRLGELTELLREDPTKATGGLIKFIENVVLPHRDKEEEHVFPVILKLKPDEKPLIEELREEHGELKRYYKTLLEGEDIKTVKEILKSLKDHTSKEEPLYRLLLEEATKK